MRILQIIFFVLCFTVDVRIHASVLTPDKAYCFQNIDPCTLKTFSNKEEFDLDEALLTLGPESTVLYGKNEFSFLSGKFLISAKKNVEILVPYGSLKIQKGGLVILEKKEDRLQIQMIFGDAFIQRIGARDKVALKSGYENYLGEVDNTQMAQVGIPRLVNIQLLLEGWSQLSYGDKESFLSEVEKFKDHYKRALEELDHLNKQMISREIASVEKRKLEENERLKRKKEQQQKQEEEYYNRLLLRD